MTKYICTNCKHEIDIPNDKLFELHKLTHKVGKIIDTFRNKKLSAITHYDLLDAGIMCCGHPAYIETEFQE